MIYLFGALTAQKENPMKYIHRLNENPTSWLLVAIVVGFILMMAYVVLTEITW
jgi:hypothetical protein